MRAGIDRIHLRIVKLSCNDRSHITLGHEHIKRIALVELVLLDNLDKPGFSIQRLSNAYNEGGFVIGLVRIDLGIVCRAVEKETRVIIPVDDLIEDHLPARVDLIVIRILAAKIHSFPVDLGNGCGIVCALDPSFDLERVDTGIQELRNMVYHADIAAAEDICSSSVFLNRERDVGALFLNDVIAPSAGLGACAAVGSSAGEIIGQKASSGI